MGILGYQLAIVASLILVRLVARRYLLAACLAWTALTIVNLFWPPLTVLQLVVVWVTYGVLTRSDPPPEPPMPALDQRNQGPAPKTARLRQSADVNISIKKAADAAALQQNEAKPMATAPKKKVHVLNSRLWDSVLPPFTAELKRLHPKAYDGAVYGGEGLVPMISKHDVRVDGKTFWEALTAAEEAFENRPLMNVRVGEFVSIGGRWFRVSSVSSSKRMISTERVDRDGSVLSSDWCHVDLPSGEQLESVATPGEDSNPWEPIPDRLRDGYDRARFLMRIHSAHLVKYGLAEDTEKKRNALVDEVIRRTEDKRSSSRNFVIASLVTLVVALAMVVVWQGGWFLAGEPRAPMPVAGATSAMAGEPMAPPPVRNGVLAAPAEPTTPAGQPAALLPGESGRGVCDFVDSIDEGIATCVQRDGSIVTMQATPDMREGQPVRAKPLPGSSCETPLDWDSAREHIGQTRAIAGRVVAVTKSPPNTRGDPTWIEVGAPFPNSKRLSLVIWGNRRSSFPTDLQELIGTRPCIVGEIQDYKGVARIELRTPDQIQFRDD